MKVKTELIKQIISKEEVNTHTQKKKDRKKKEVSEQTGESKILGRRELKQNQKEKTVELKE